MVIKSWKFRCQQQCLVKLHCAEVAGKPFAVLGNTRQRQMNCRSWRVYENSIGKSSLKKYHEDRICCKWNNFTQSLQFGAQVWSNTSSIKISGAKAAVKRWEKLEKILAWQLTKVRNKSRPMVRNLSSTVSASSSYPRKIRLRLKARGHLQLQWNLAR